MSVFHAVPMCYTTPISVGMWIPTECTCHIVAPWLLCMSNSSYNVGTPFSDMGNFSPSKYLAGETVFMFLCMEGGGGGGV